MKITADAITLENQIYPTKNISSAKMITKDTKVELQGDERNAAMKQTAIWFVASLVVAYVCFFMIGGLVFVILGIFALLFLIGSALEFFQTPTKTQKEYGLELLTNAGAVSLFWSSNEEFMQEVKEAVFEAISTSSDNPNYYVNIEKQEISDNSTVTINNTVINNFDYSIQEHHHAGLSKEDLAFLTGEFNTEIARLGEAIEGSKNDEMIEQYRAIVEGFNTPEPDGGVLLKGWKRLKSLCEGYEVAATLGSAGATILSGINLFL